LKECKRNGGIEFNHDVVKIFSSDQHVEWIAVRWGLEESVGRIYMNQKLPER
jgi:hypothetical protein